MVVEVGPEIQQFILKICARPEQHVIQIFGSNGANEPFHEGMRLGNAGDGLDFCHLQDPQIGLPLVELRERIMVGAEVLWQPALTSKGAVKHATACDPIDRAGMDYACYLYTGRASPSWREPLLFELQKPYRTLNSAER
jgi:hypothetical protein